MKTIEDQIYDNFGFICINTDESKKIYEKIEKNIREEIRRRIRDNILWSII